MNKSHAGPLNSGTSKLAKKLSIETKNTSSIHPQIGLQSAKNEVKPSANSITSYRLLQYVLLTLANFS